MQNVKLFSMFSGIGGFELGITKALGDKAIFVGHSEIDTYANNIYSKHFPSIVNYGDATRIDTDTIPDFDFLVGGFPCQAFSVAGKRRGFDDTRGTLFFEIARILKDKRPRYFLLENVKGLLSHDGGKTFQTILKVLADLGYECEWQVLNSKDFGVPQNRERIFIIGNTRGSSRSKIFPLIGTGKKDKSKVSSTAIDSNYFKGPDRHGQRTMIEITQNVSDALRVYDPKGVAKTLKGLGGGMGAKTGLYVVSSNIRRLTPIECERLQGFPDNYTSGVSDTQRYKCLGNAVTVNVIEYLFNQIYK